MLFKFNLTFFKFSQRFGFCRGFFIRRFGGNFKLFVFADTAPRCLAADVVAASNAAVR